MFSVWRMASEGRCGADPVTALLHAVAVVQGGAFTLMRITYYSFGASFLRGTWAQTVVMVFVLITIVYGCSRALKRHIFKKAAGLFYDE